MPCCCAQRSDYESFFGRRAAERDARRFRRRGLRGSSRTLVELAGSVHGESVLEVGGGIGAIELELLEAGADRATNVELSRGYERAAGELLSERGLADRVDRRIGDFASDADSIEPHDVVVMHRVVCCYPDVDALVGAAAERTRHRLLLTYPQERPLIRAGARLANMLLRVRGSTFRVFVHPVSRIEEIAHAHGLEPTTRRRHGLVWESAAFSR
ncbi:MAG TPA: methyltransferase domain-containing protein [Gaiellaceae bacterium]|nr:methyltransferase domain-containing protein [Gaiellaceae bacterium]